MNFADAVKELKSGCSIRRKSWDESNFIDMDVQDIKIIDGRIEDVEPFNVILAFRLEAFPFNMDANIIISEDWNVVGTEEVIDFPTAFEMAKSRNKIKLKEWPATTYLEVDPSGNELFMRKLASCNYTPTFECFNALDWEVVE